jgi:hypothetical protein
MEVHMGKIGFVGLAFAISGLVLPCILIALTPWSDMAATAGAVLFCLGQGVSLVCGVIAWREPVGKASAGLAASMLVFAVVTYLFFSQASNRARVEEALRMEEEIHNVENRKSGQHK